MGHYKENVGLIVVMVQ